MPENHFKTNLFFFNYDPPYTILQTITSQTLSRHVHQMTIRNETKKNHNLVFCHKKNYPYNTEFVSWFVDHFSLFIFFPIRWGGGSTHYWKFPIFLFFFIFKTFPKISTLKNSSMNLPQLPLNFLNIQAKSSDNRLLIISI